MEEKFSGNLQFLFACFCCYIIYIYTHYQQHNDILRNRKNYDSNWLEINRCDDWKCISLTYHQ
uniref:Uncharacterized protein n=1 Tax=Octopus bimaculoides TaxID=37653 RepID=A0A0L8HZX4_OCTBM